MKKLITVILILCNLRKACSYIDTYKGPEITMDFKFAKVPYLTKENTSLCEEYDFVRVRDTAGTIPVNCKLLFSLKGRYIIEYGEIDNAILEVKDPCSIWNPTASIANECWTIWTEIIVIAGIIAIILAILLGLIIAKYIILRNRNEDFQEVPSRFWTFIPIVALLLPLATGCAIPMEPIEQGPQYTWTFQFSTTGIVCKDNRIHNIGWVERMISIKPIYNITEFVYTEGNHYVDWKYFTTFDIWNPEKLEAELPHPEITIQHEECRHGIAPFLVKDVKICTTILAYIEDQQAYEVNLLTSDISTHSITHNMKGCRITSIDSDLKGQSTAFILLKADPLSWLCPISEYNRFEPLLTKIFLTEKGYLIQGPRPTCFLDSAAERLWCSPTHETIKKLIQFCTPFNAQKNEQNAHMDGFTSYLTMNALISFDSTTKNIRISCNQAWIPQINSSDCTIQEATTTGDYVGTKGYYALIKIDGDKNDFMHVRSNCLISEAILPCGTISQIRLSSYTNCHFNDIQAKTEMIDNRFKESLTESAQTARLVTSWGDIWSTSYLGVSRTSLIALGLIVILIIIVLKKI